MPPVWLMRWALEKRDKRSIKMVKLARTEGKWEVVEHRDDSCDKQYFDYSIISYPYGVERGSQLICDGLSKFDAESICACVNAAKDKINGTN